MYRCVFMLIGLLGLGVAPLITVAQTEQPIKISFFTESTSVPFTTLVPTPMHPGVQVGTEWEGQTSEHLRLYPSVNVGYLFHRNLFQGLYANVELGFSYRFGFGLNLKSALGVGYLQTFAVQQEFQWENGMFVSKRDQGNARLMPSFSLGLGYRLNPSNARSTELFMMHQTWIEYPYSPGFIPLMSHTNIHIGSVFYPFQHNP